MALGVGALTLAGAACNNNSGICSGGSGSLSGTVTDAPTGAPLAQPLIAIQSGGLDPVNPDPSKGAPTYTVGQQANYHGNFSIQLPCGVYGVHAFMSGYHALGAAVRNGENAALAMEPLNPNAKLPTLGAPQLSATSVRANTPMTLDILVQAADPSDPLTEQVLLLNPVINRAQALDPPSAGSGAAFPDGTWHTTFQAPQVGTYTYTVVAVTASAVTGFATFQLAVTY